MGGDGVEKTKSPVVKYTKISLRVNKEQDPNALSIQSITGVENQPNLSYVTSFVNLGMTIVAKSLSNDEKELFRESYRRYFEFKKKSLALTRDWRIYHSRLAIYEKKTKQGVKAVKPLPPKPTPPVSREEDPAFSHMDPAPTPATHHAFQPSAWRPGEDVVVRRFVGNAEVAFDPTQDVYPSLGAPLSFSLIAVGRWVW